mmetsp:Transcript_35867/g.26646  ORF Transcript_35867/g.26646 Transcript_35867/m.26646 type:complete len:98 (+) Transcript_35867:318-611(+)
MEEDNVEDYSEDSLTRDIKNLLFRIETVQYELQSFKQRDISQMKGVEKSLYWQFWGSILKVGVVLVVSVLQAILVKTCFTRVSKGGLPIGIAGRYKF